jgi:ribosomal protein S27AE
MWPFKKNGKGRHRIVNPTCPRCEGRQHPIDLRDGICTGCVGELDYLNDTLGPNTFGQAFRPWDTPVDPAPEDVDWLPPNPFVKNARCPQCGDDEFPLVFHAGQLMCPVCRDVDLIENHTPAPLYGFTRVPLTPLV